MGRAEKKSRRSHNIKYTFGKTSGTVSRATYILGQVVILLWVLFTVVIIGWICIASFSSTRDIFSNKLLKSGMTLSGFKIVFQEYKMGKYFLNSIINTAAACIGLIFICAPAAFALSRFKFRGKRIFDVVFSAAMGMPGVMLLVPLFMMVVKLNVSDYRLTLWLIYIGIGIPFTIVYLRGFFSTLPMEVFQSALIDGCSYIRAFWKVMFPMAQPGIVTVTIFNFISYWNEYIWALSLANDEEKRSLSVGLQLIARSMGTTGNYTGLFAASVVVFLPTLILYLLLSEKIVGGLTDGALKG